MLNNYIEPCKRNGIADRAIKKITASRKSIERRPAIPLLIKYVDVLLRKTCLWMKKDGQ